MGIIILSLIILNIYVLSLVDFEEKEEKPIINIKKEEPKNIKIDVKGAVNKVGLYELQIGSRVNDAIQKAGGLTQNADTSIINLSKKLEDEMVIIVYTKQEVEKFKNNSETIKCDCPKENDACIKEEQLDTFLEERLKTNKEKQTKTQKETNKNQKLSINTATEEELQTLDGIGESKAKAIVEYRNKNGKFKTIEDLQKVNGIGESLIEKIKDNITF